MIRQSIQLWMYSDVDFSIHVNTCQGEMMKSTKYLLKVAEKFELLTKSAIAEKLGLSKQAVSNYLSEARVMDEETCLAVALALDINPVEIMMAAGIDRAEKTGQKSLWEIFVQKGMAISPDSSYNSPPVGALAQLVEQRTLNP